MKMLRLVLIAALMPVVGGCALRPQVMDGDGMFQVSENEPNLQDDNDLMDDRAELSFESFDGGGPDFNVVIEDGGIVSCECSREYNDPDHEETDGAGYRVKYSFTGLKPGETGMTIEERSPIADNLDHIYRVRVDEELHVEIELIETRDKSF